jgi:hypothetical protein
MKLTIVAVLCLTLSLALVCNPAAAQQGAGPLSAEPPAGGVQSLEDRMRHLEQAVERTVTGQRWFERVKIGGRIEVEAGYVRVDFDDPEAPDDKSSDIDLGKAELTLDAKLAAHVDAHLRITYEDDDLFLDEGFITLTGPERFPAYLIAGRQYIPFGHFESHFVTDPATLLLGETNEGAVVVGYPFLGDAFHVSLGLFNSKVDRIGSDSKVRDYVGRIAVSPFEGWQFGASYISNLASADAFAEAVNELSDDVPGWSLFASATLFDRLTLIGEYVAAVKRFQAGELFDADDTVRHRPSAWNLEVGYALTDAWQVALRYGGSRDAGSGAGQFLPETQYGGVVNWALFDNTSLSLEFLHSAFRNQDRSDAIVAQIAVLF